MLYQIGPLQIRVHPFNADRLSGEISGGYAEKAVLGRRPPLEAVGAGPETLELTGTLFPFKLGGLGELELVKQLVEEQVSVSVTRGDGAWQGFYVIEKLTDNHSKLHFNGVAQVIEYTMSLKRDDPPSGLDFFDSLMSLIA